MCEEEFTNDHEYRKHQHQAHRLVLFTLFSFFLYLCISSSLCEYRKHQHQANKLFFHFIFCFFSSLFIYISLSVFATTVNISIKYISCSFILLCLSFSLSVPLYPFMYIFSNFVLSLLYLLIVSRAFVSRP